MPPLHLLLPLSYLLLLTSAASNPTSFCKCTCGANSTIIPLDAPTQHSTRSFPQQPQPDILQILHPRNDEAKDEGSSSSSLVAANNEKEPSSGEEDGDKGHKDEDRKEYRKKTCNDCNKQYCLSQHLHICEGVKTDEVFTTCFQRDSRKDEAVVFIFIFATAGLLGWAALKPWVGAWIDSARERRTYMAVSGEGDG